LLALIYHFRYDIGTFPITALHRIHGEPSVVFMQALQRALDNYLATHTKPDGLWFTSFLEAVQKYSQID
jgi:hypothetical protein